MSKITVIIPMHVFTDADKKLLERAVGSVDKGADVVVAVPNSASDADLKGMPKRAKAVRASEGSSFQELVNGAVTSVDTEWFSILEYDDTYTDIWYKHAEEYIEAMPSTSVFMYIQDLWDFNANTYIGLGNEAAWASAFSDEIGHLDVDALKNYFDFYVCGSIFNTSDWKEVGGLKTKIKLVFWYEFLLRITNKGKDVFVIPKVGGNHYLGRDGSLSRTAKEEISEEEGAYLFRLARKEYFVSTDRDVDSFEEWKAKNDEEEDEE